MAMAGEEKEMRMAGSLGYNSPIENTLDHRPRPSDTDRYSGAGNIAGAIIGPNSGGSKVWTPPEINSTRYRECLKNHAASIGGSVTDGCGEFMPGGEEGTLEALKCAACNCHRNFHRKETAGDGMTTHLLQLPPPPLSSPTVNQARAISMGVHGNHWTVARPVKMAFGGGGGSAATDSSSEELNFNSLQPSPGAVQPFGLAKKRFRTKFTAEQKEKMLEFAEKVGWRIPKEDDAEAQRFCAEVGVKRQVLKVWMHNNKSSAKKNLPET